MKKLLTMWLFVWFLFTISTQAEELVQIQLKRLPQLMDCGTVSEIGQRIAAQGQIPFLQADGSMQVPNKGADPNIIFGEIMIFMNQQNSSYSMVFKLPTNIQAKGGPALCIFGVGHKLRPAMTQPQVETVF
tara:strand:+ start:353 stop:745 length:393 start_codon:yes stop_codon:yes gene_type:complete